MKKITTPQTALDHLNNFMVEQYLKELDAKTKIETQK